MASIKTPIADPNAALGLDASLRLAVVESRAQYVEPMHKGT